MRRGRLQSLNITLSFQAFGESYKLYSLCSVGDTTARRSTRKAEKLLLAKLLFVRAWNERHRSSQLRNEAEVGQSRQ